MSLFPFLWLRRLIRNNTTPINRLTAEQWKRRLSFGYIFFAWNAFGLVCYAIYKGNSDWAAKYKSAEELSLTPAQQWARTLKINDAKVYRISRDFKVQSYEIHEDNQDKDEVETEREELTS